AGRAAPPELGRCRLRADLMNGWLWEIQEGLEAYEEPATTQGEEREESEGDERVAQRQRQAVAVGHRGEDDEDTLQEDRDEGEERHHVQRFVTLGRSSGQALEQIGERDEPADGQDDPGH